VITDAELRENHEFVTAFETLRKRHGHREMSDFALRQIADAAGVDYETLRLARHLRNALAHDEPVNRETLRRYLDILTALARPPEPLAATAEPARADDTKAYRLHAWRDPDLERAMLANGFVSIGGDEIGDLAGVTDPEDIRAWLTDSMPGRTPRAISLFVGYWRRFVWEAGVGDLVVLPTRERDVAIGELVGPYRFVETADPHARHRRAVSWIAAAVDRDAFGADLITTLNGQHTVQEFKAPRAVERLRSLAARGTDPGPSAVDRS
jgi:hypothetical protein